MEFVNVKKYDESCTAGPEKKVVMLVTVCIYLGVFFLTIPSHREAVVLQQRHQVCYYMDFKEVSGVSVNVAAHRGLSWDLGGGAASQATLLTCLRKE